MLDLVWTWILNQSINRRGYRTESGTRSILWFASLIVVVAAITTAALIWVLWPGVPRQPDATPTGQVQPAK